MSSHNFVSHADIRRTGRLKTSLGRISRYCLIAGFGLTSGLTILSNHGSCLSSALIPTAQAADEVLGADVGKHLQDAQAAFSAGNTSKAMAAVNAADSVSKKSDYERYVIAQMRAAVAARSGDSKTALAAYDILIASPRTPKASKGQMLMAEASLAYGAKDYARAEQAAGQYLHLFGYNAQMRTILMQSCYLQKDWAGVVKFGKANIEADEKARRTPQESELQMLATAYGNLHDSTGQTSAYVKLVKYYPRPQYWQILIHNLVTDSSLNQRLVFNVQRLRLATKVLTNPDEFHDMGERATQIGLPQLALNLINEGYNRHILGNGAKADSDAKFRNFLMGEAAKVKAGLPAAVQAARQDKGANASLVAGYNLVLYGQVDAGLALMQDGLKKNPKMPDIAQLDYAMALMDGGRKKEAIAAFNRMEGEGPAQDLAQLWAVYLAMPAK